MKKIIVIAAFLTILFPVVSKAQSLIGTRVEVLWNGKWYPATIDDEHPDKINGGTMYYVEYGGYTHDYDEWVKADRVRFNLIHFNKGDHVLTLWKDVWYKSTILEAGEDAYLIHYDGWSDEWNEWASFGRVKKQ